MSRLAEYLVEIGELEKAASAGEALRRFPGTSARSLRAPRCKARMAIRAGLTQTLNSLLSRLSTGADRYLPWDRRVSLAIVLARADRVDLSREQVRRCLTELNGRRSCDHHHRSLYNLSC